jgi:hypothetical protein
MPDPTEKMSAEAYRKSRADAKLVSETEWMRVYELAPKSFSYESRFLTDGLQISAESFASRWPTMTPTERQGFASAYGAKADFSPDDEQIIDLIMKDGDDHVWNSLVLFMLSTHTQRDRVLAFIREKLEKHPDNPSNYIQALGIARDQSAVPILLPYYDEFHSEAKAVPERPDANFEDVLPIAKFLWCSEALFRITESTKFADGIQVYLKYPHPQVQWWARHALGEDRE